MRITLLPFSAALLTAALLVVACEVELEGEPPEVSIGDVTWSDDQIEVEVTTNLPEGAILAWQVVEGDDLDLVDPVDVAGVTTVTDDGAASVVADVSGFTDDQALVEVSFARFAEQPAEVLQDYDVEQEASDESLVRR